METEEAFFLSLRAVVIHMIKHVEPSYYTVMAPVLEIHEKNEWDDLSHADRIAKVEEVKQQLAPDGPVSKYFDAYPHEWSRERYAKLKCDLDNYLAELKGKNG